MERLGQGESASILRVSEILTTDLQPSEIYVPKPVILTPRRFVNTDLFREAALYFEKHKVYTREPVNTRRWMEFWKEEERRIVFGYEVAGMRITGYHYWYLNYCRVKKVVGKTSTYSFPDFWDWDYNYYWCVEIARYGLKAYGGEIDVDYDSLGLSVNIRVEDRCGGRHMAVLKARRKGYSYKSGSMMARHYFFGRDSRCWAMANLEGYLLEGDGLLSKTWEMLDFVDENTPFRQGRLKNTQMLKQAGYQQKIDGVVVDKGRKNVISGLSLKDDPDKVRGKQGDLGFFEEAGKLPGLKTAWEVARGSYEQGDVMVGLMIAFGTGGTEGANFEGLEFLFENPDANNCLCIENVWDEGGQGWGGFFVPASMNLQGFMDEDGNSKEKAAVDWLMEQREKIKKASDATALDQRTAEYPLTPREAMLQTGTNLFPSAALKAQLDRVLAERLWAMHPSGRLYRDADGQIKLMPTESPAVITRFPLAKGDDKRGAIQIYEAPFRQGLRPPKGMYVVCHDPYAHDGDVTSESLGSAFVIKMTNRLSTTYNDCIVASWTGRPDTQDEYNEQLFHLAEYYNAEIGFENDRGEVIPYAKRNRLLHRLAEQFEMLHKRELQSKTVNREYGMHMTPARKQQAELYIRDWMSSTISVMEDGSRRTVLHTIHDVGLLRELLKYRKDGNFDRVSALMIGMYHMKEMTHKQIQEEVVDDPIKEFFLREHYAGGV